VLVPEAHHVGRLGVEVTLVAVERFLPGRQQPAVRRIDVAAFLGRPAGEPLGEHGHVVFGPPELVVGGGPDLAHDAAGDRAPDGRVQVRGQAALGLDGGEVLDVIARTAAQVLPEPVGQLGEVQSVERRPPVVVAVTVDGHALGVDPPIRGQGQGEEHRRAVGAAVGCGVHPADGPVLHREPGQVGHVRAAPGRPHPPVRLVLVALVVVLAWLWVRSGLVFWLGVEVPAFPALLDAQPQGPVCAQRTAVLPGRPTRDRNVLHLARLQVGDPGDHGAGAHPGGLGGGLDDMAGDGHGVASTPVGHCDGLRRCVKARCAPWP
jgi:hypothetical protein